MPTGVGTTASPPVRSGDRSGRGPRSRDPTGRYLFSWSFRRTITAPVGIRMGGRGPSTPRCDDTAVGRGLAPGARVGHPSGAAAGPCAGLGWRLLHGLRGGQAAVSAMDKPDCLPADCLPRVAPLRRCPEPPRPRLAHERRERRGNRARAAAGGRGTGGLCRRGPRHRNRRGAVAAARVGARRARRSRGVVDGPSAATRTRGNARRRRWEAVAKWSRRMRGGGRRRGGCSRRLSPSHSSASTAARNSIRCAALIGVDPCTGVESVQRGTVRPAAA